MIFSVAPFAKIIKIKVSNFQFTPATVNAVKGDTIVWIWKDGFHTTTSLSIPPGAKAWDTAINSSSLRFRYKVVKAGTYNYQCTIHAPNMKGTIIVSATSPAGLEDFTVLANAAQPVLNWKIVSPKDVAYFSVQRSTDGQTFTEVKKITAAVANSYSYKDDNTLRDKFIYYQVAVTDKDGNQQLSPVQLFVNKNAAAKLVTSLSPNPVNRPGHLMLQFNADKEGSMQVKLYNQNGVLIKQADMYAVKGLNNGHFHIGDVSPGNYYIVCTLGSLTEKHAIIVK